MSDANHVYEPPRALVEGAHVSGMEAYRKLVAEAERDFEGFWARLARENVQWTKPFTRTLDESNAPFYKWFEDGELNASANCLDKHIGTPVENKTAIIFEADDGAVSQVTYRELRERVGRFANALKAQGIRKGDRVVIYMPMGVEGVVAMQACARIGATHSVVFGGFSAKSLQERIIDAGAVAVITANFQMRGGKEMGLKSIVDEALAAFETMRPALVLLDVMMPGRDGWEVCRIMKQHATLGRHTRVVMVTALGEWEDKRAALQTGADDYMTKPVDLPTLIKVVERNLAAGRAAS